VVQHIHFAKDYSHGIITIIIIIIDFHFKGREVCRPFGNYTLLPEILLFGSLSPDHIPLKNCSQVGGTPAICSKGLRFKMLSHRMIIVTKIVNDFLQCLGFRKLRTI
jgi:hypothetical protein